MSGNCAKHPWNLQLLENLGCGHAKGGRGVCDLGRRHPFLFLERNRSSAIHRKQTEVHNIETVVANRYREFDCVALLRRLAKQTAVTGERMRFITPGASQLSPWRPASLASSRVQLALTPLARFLVVAVLTEIRENARLFAFLLESPQGAFKTLVRKDDNFRHQACTPIHVVRKVLI
jgi:hypothetical protein